ncbi:acyltransferase family protein [Enterococcus avium]|uniref:acyltransferase family protein n=1 Tax=Enterococcus avium TaxID=33945 RepID=UPI00321B80B6
MRSRDNQIDNIKGLLIFLVVFGHMLLVTSKQDNSLLTLIYSFHMPAFIFLNGFFSKKADMKRVVLYGSLFLVFQIMYIIVAKVANYPWLPSSNIFFIPVFHIWYLLSLSCWYFISVMINKFSINRRIILIVSILTALLIRYTNLSIDGNFLSYLRTIVFAPFFIIGFYVTKDDLSKLRNTAKRSRVPFLLILFLLLGLNYWYFAPRSGVWMKLFYGYVNFSSLNQNAFIFLIKEIVQYCIAGMFIILLLVLVTKRKGLLNYLGKHTLYIFIFHPIVYFFVYNHIQKSDTEPISEVSLAIVLSIISIVFSIFLENFWFWIKNLFKRE